MEDEVCNVYGTFMFSLLGAESWRIGCEHRELAIVTFSTVDRTTYVTFMTEAADIGFKFDAHGCTKLFQDAVQLDITKEGDDVID